MFDNIILQSEKLFLPLRANTLFINQLNIFQKGMKKFFTLSSVFAVCMLCWGTLATAQEQQTPFIDCGQTGSSYMPDVVYVDHTATAEFWIRGKNLQGDVTFRGFSDKDTQAIFEFNPATVTKAKVEAGTEMESEIVKVNITPKAIIPDAKYFLEVITSGYTAEPIEIVFPPVVDTIPRYTFEVENPYGNEIFVGGEYESTLYVKGYEYVKGITYLVIPEGSDIVSITPNELTKEQVSEQFGTAVKVRFRPSKATEGEETARTTFPLIVRTEGMQDLVCDYVACHVTAAAPKVEITAGMYGKDAYIGETIKQTIWVKGNPYLQGDITLSKVNDDDDMTFEPAVISKEAAQTEDGAAVVVSITPKVSSNGKMAYFYFKASTLGTEDTEAYIRIWEVKDRLPEVTLQVPGYIAVNGMVGKNKQVEIQVVANEYTTNDITLYSDDEQVRAFDPSVVSAEAAKKAGGAKVIVYIRPTTESETAYTKQSFIIKARTEGALADAEATIQFAVDPNDGTGTDTDPEIETGLNNTTATCKIWSAQNTLFVQLTADAYVEIYNIAGQCVANQQTNAGTTTFNLQNGMYILKINNTTTKVIVK